jgi:hypothetical protein
MLHGLRRRQAAQGVREGPSPMQAVSNQLTKYWIQKRRERLTAFGCA